MLILPGVFRGLGLSLEPSDPLPSSKIWGVALSSAAYSGQIGGNNPDVL